MTCGIYKLTFIGIDKCYIGQSINIEKRYKQHLYDMKNGTSNNKLLDAYEKYGRAILYIILECQEFELDANEEEAISIYNSVVDGFNIYKFSNQAPVLKGVEHGNAKYTKQQLIESFELLAKTSLMYTEIEKITGVSKATVYNISKGLSHVWLSEEFPDLVKCVIDNIQKRKVVLASINAEYCKNNYSAKAKGIVYPPIISPSGAIYTVDNVQEFARVHGISKSSLHRILTKEVKQCKGWRLQCQEEPV
jgi:group I intron endonuclease